MTAGTTTADGSCADCASGEWDDDGDATTICVAHTATDCSAVADGSEVAGTITTDTYCGCDENFFAVGDGSCSACTSGTNAAGDDAAGSATTCDE